VSHNLIHINFYQGANGTRRMADDELADYEDEMLDDLRAGEGKDVKK